MRELSAASRIDNMRLILESTPSDEELSNKLERVGEEIRAINQTIQGNDSYLGIDDEEKLKDRLKTLTEKRDLVREERELLHKVRIAVADVERVPEGREERAATESPGLDSSIGSAAKSAPVEASGDQAIGSSSSAKATPGKPFSPFFLQDMKESGFDEFLKKNATSRSTSIEKTGPGRTPPTRPQTTTVTGNTTAGDRRPIPFNMGGGDDVEDDRAGPR